MSCRGGGRWFVFQITKPDVNVFVVFAARETWVTEGYAICCA